jgi:LmbE family N-acetylglucosaminyl deacetylase
MKEPSRTLMAVHAHPDDEASSTGGILARYGAEGVDTVVVTCTNGELGDSADGARPGEPGHDEELLVAQRRRELEQSCEILGVDHLELLGYHDSGMMGWAENDVPGVFWGMPVDEAAAPLAAIMERYVPDVIVTYDEYGFYGHPDHIQAHRITVQALRMTGIPAKLFCPTVRRSRLGAFRDRMGRAGVDIPDIDETRFGSPDEDIAASIDCRAYAVQKLDALQAHASQHENIFFLRLPVSDFTEMFGTEEFIRLPRKPGAVAPAGDLFAN